MERLKKKLLIFLIIIFTTCLYRSIFVSRNYVGIPNETSDTNLRKVDGVRKPPVKAQKQGKNDEFVRIKIREMAQHNQMAGKQCKKETNRKFDLKTKHKPQTILNGKNNRFELGGHWIPPNVTNNTPNVTHDISRIAIIIPFKDRDEHLSTWLWYMIPFLQEQKLDFRVFVVEQVGDVIFNKGATFNAGFKEVNKLGKFGCIILHDVDLLAENACNLYKCQHNTVVHLSSAVSTLGYKMFYWTLLGGVVAFEPHVFQDVNGLTSAFYGRGGEDDDFSARLHARRKPVVKSNIQIGRYKMIEHIKKNQMDRSIPESDKHGRMFWSCDGLNSVKYHLESVELLPLYTRIKISLTGPKTVKEGINNYRIQFLNVHSNCNPNGSIKKS